MFGNNSLVLKYEGVCEPVFEKLPLLVLFVTKGDEPPNGVPMASVIYY